jgi:hypothetical protein
MTVGQNIPIVIRFYLELGFHQDSHFSFYLRVPFGFRKLVCYYLSMPNDIITAMAEFFGDILVASALSETPR